MNELKDRTMSGPLLTQQEVADFLKVKVRTLEKWRHKRCGPPYFKLSPNGEQTVRYPYDELLNWLAERREE